MVNLPTSRRHVRLNLLFALAIGIAGISTEPAMARVSVGSKAPVFELPEAKVKGAPNKTLRLEKTIASNTLTVLIFVATRCPYSNAYNNRMRQLAKQFQSQRVAFVGINSNVTEPADEVALHRRENKLPFPIVKDAGSKFADAYGATKTPEVFVVNREGTVVYHGRIDENFQKPLEVKSPDLKNALSALLSGEKLERSTTKAFGCSIKRPG